MRNLLSLVFLSLLINSCSKDISYYSSKVLKKGQFVQMPFTVRRDLIFVKATVGGKSGNFLFDTGAKSLVFPDFDSAIVNSTKKVENEIVSDVHGNEQKVENKFYKTDFGGLKIKKHQFALIPKPSVLNTNCLNVDTIDGFIGNDLLNQGVFAFNPKKSMLTIYHDVNQVPDLNLYKKYSINTENGYLFVELNGGYYMFDSGATQKFIQSNDSTLFDYNQKIDTISNIVSGAFSDTVLQSYSQRKKLEVLGDTHSVYVYYSPAVMNLFGVPWMLKYDVIFDVVGKAIYIKNNNDFFLDGYQVNYKIKIYKGNLIIVSKKGTQNLFKVGDKVIEVNGISTESIKTECDWVDFKKANNITQIQRFCIDKNGEKVCVEIEDK